MSSLPVRIAWRRGEPAALLSSREWLVSNGLGGYASGTLGGVPTRRYHGTLMASLSGRHGRALMLNDVVLEASAGGGARVALCGLEGLEEVRFEGGLPVWTYARAGIVLEKRVVMPNRQNTTYLVVRVLRADGPLTLSLRPWIHFREHGHPLVEHAGEAHVVHVDGRRCTVEADGALPPLRMIVTAQGARFVLDGGTTRDVELTIERSRGYEYRERQWSPGWFEAPLTRDEETALIASTEAWERMTALTAHEALAAERARRTHIVSLAQEELREGVGAELVLAADQFLVKPQMRAEDAARAYASGRDVETVIAGYHWFTDWGRDTMISLEGLALATGRRREACSILRMFADHVRDGLIPNLFPEGAGDGLYHTADATLWFFHAIDRYTAITGDREVLRDLFPILEEILEKHVQGTRFGIHVDPTDGLLSQGAEGYALTWMDAKVGDWVVTPRRGKAVEINALYYNALRTMERWAREERGEAAAERYHARAERACASFNRRYWCEHTGCLYDVLDGPAGDDDAIRPNQVMAISLPHPVLDQRRWREVLDVVRDKLVTPVGLRTLSPGHADYKSTYDGDLRARDAAYHQGTVWPWLIGPYSDAWRKVHPDDDPHVLAEDLARTLGEACIGSISEIYDAESPQEPRGCVAQAWSVAETIRVLVRSRSPTPAPSRPRAPSSSIP